MFKHIIVPLDGSRLAEASLPAAARLAEKFGASITLVHIIEKGAPEKIHGDRHLAAVEEAEEYLAAIAKRALFASLKVEAHVHSAEVSDLAHGIAEHEDELMPDLIVLTTHGKRDARQLILGTIAQQVIALGKTPVLVVKPTDRGSELFAPRPGKHLLILAPVDGSLEHEKGLPIAAELAATFRARLHLLMVVPKLGNLRGPESSAALISPNAMRVRLEIDSEGAKTYLEALSQRLTDVNIAIATESARGDAPKSIVKAARRLEASLIVLSTHGKAGSEAFWSESVAARVATKTGLPVLLVPVKER